MSKTNTKIILSILIFIFTKNISIADSWNSLLYTKSIRANIMDSFKNEQYSNIFDWWNVLLENEDLNFYDTLNKNEVFEKIRNNILNSKKDLTDKKELLTTRKINLEETIKELDKDIENANNEITSISRDLLNTNDEIERLRIEVDNIQKEITQNKEILLEYIAHIYKKSNLIYEGDDIDSIKTIFLNWWNLSDIFNDIHFSSIIEVTWQSLIEKHRKLIRQLFVKRLSMESKMEKLRELRKQEVIKRKAILEKKAFRQKILDYTSWQEELFEKYINEKEISDKRLQIRILQNKITIKDQKEELLKKFNCEYVDIDSIKFKYFYLLNKDREEKSSSNYSCIELNKILEAESKLKSFDLSIQNVLSWPIEPTKWLSAYYKDQEYLNIVWTTHDAIDIKADQWTEIKAPADWYVTFMEEPDDEWYAYIVLKHADWFVTVYWHVSEILVWEYDFVRKWQVFAKSWWEFWTNWAWIMTTGPHLHFEVYKDKSYVDPLDYLDLTILWEKNVPALQKYVYKYMDDYKALNWVDYDWDLVNDIKIFSLSWATEVDRQKDLLNKYATSDFNNWDMWVEEAINWDIDPSFIMCIWLAESWLWRNLKTPYNVWNVGNTDSWWTWDLPNARSWIYRIVKTLNNKFLRDYNDMSKLSRYWNTNWSIYASSPDHWHNNIIKCLTALKETSIPDNYNFRLEE